MANMWEGPRPSREDTIAAPNPALDAEMRRVDAAIAAGRNERPPGLWDKAKRWASGLDFGVENKNTPRDVRRKFARGTGMQNGMIYDPLSGQEVPWTHGNATSQEQADNYDRFKDSKSIGEDVAKWRGETGKKGGGGGNKKTPPKSDAEKYVSETRPKIDAMDKALHAWRTRKGKLDLSPLLALTDSLTGSDILRGYEAPEDGDERMAIDMKLQMGLEEHKRKIEHSKNWLLNSEAQLKEKKRHNRAMENAELMDSVLLGGANNKKFYAAKKAEMSYQKAVVEAPRNRSMLKEIAKRQAKGKKLDHTNPAILKHLEGQIINYAWEHGKKHEQKTGKAGGYEFILEGLNIPGNEFGGKGPQVE